MPSTPKSLKLGFQRNSYSRVSFGKALQEEAIKKLSSGDAEPLQDGNQMQQNGTVPTHAGVEYINAGLEDQMEIQGYVRDKLRTTVCWVLIAGTLGALRLVFHWWPHWMLYATHRPCSLDVAEKVLVIERYQQKHKCYYVKNIKIITPKSARNWYNQEDKNKLDQPSFMELEQLEYMKLSVHTSGGKFRELEEVRMFTCKKLTYVWDPDRNEFYKLRGFDDNMCTSSFHQQKGLSATEQFLRRAVFGSNEIIVPMRSVTALLFLEVLNPFYIFQLFSFTLWIVDDYVYYALTILIMSIFSIVFAVIQTRRNQMNLSSTVHSRDVASVLRVSGADIEVVVVPTEQLVPGDVLVVPSHGCIMHCDAVLLTGNCIVNESMLTGESVPVTKTPLPNAQNMSYNEREHGRHTLFCGTQVIQTRYYGNERVCAVVVRTSFSTAKGSLVRSILYPPPVDFKFERDSYKFVQMLAVVAAVGVIYTVISKLLRGNPVGEVTLEALDLITIVVPPALPAAMTIGRMYAQTRLKKSDIFCISPRTINVSGSINCVCFDKTGTLTEDGLDMWGVVPIRDSHFHLPVKNIETLFPDHLLKAMVSCHSLTVIDGNLTGDPLDLKMFESTRWILEEPEVSDETKFDLISPTVVKPPGDSQGIISDNIEECGLQIGIVRQFPFSSSLQRMSVITRRLGAREYTVYCKGSPEMVLSLCNPATVPETFERELEKYTREGYRVLAVGYQDLPAKMSYAKMQRLSRQEAESKLTMLGLVVMENRLKPQTTGALAMLTDANIRTVMVTGDNMLTALSVARECQIVPHGERVIMIHILTNNGNNNSQPPTIYFTQSNPGPSPDTAHFFNEITQMTDMESVTSLQTLESVTAVRTANGTARTCIIPELPIDNTIVSDDIEQGGSKYTFALTGSTWTALREHYPDLLAKVTTRGSVFARMSPDHKQQLIQELQSLDYYVAMVGDGANDCGALKAAHAGISLSEAESSVASPFTSKQANISCIVEVIREGRSALVTSFSIFKYMAAYSLMQFASVMILYSINSNLTDIEFLYIDLFVITTFAFVLGRVEAYRGPLYPEPPQSSLISLCPILSLAGQMVLAISAQLFSFYWVQEYSWYKSGDEETSFENYSVFAVSSLQYIILALVFSKGAPYRKSLFTLPLLVLATVLITVFTLYLIIYPAEWFVHKFEMRLPPEYGFRILMVLVAFINLILAAAYEWLCEYSRVLINRLKNKVLTGYEVIDKALLNSPDWPPISEDPPIENPPPPPPQPKPTMKVVSTPQIDKRFGNLGHSSINDLQLEELKFSTPMRSMVSLMGTHGVNQSEDSLSGYLTPPTSPSIFANNNNKVT